jgi:hypothetical protein
MIKWLEDRTTVSGNRVRRRLRVLYGVQVYAEGQWMHAHRNGKPLIFASEARAQAERKKLRALRAA